ncbi:hypothetical protein GCM10007415_25600 [Parapedobacter pyrenivorans]|uniref:Beta-lactamase-related domain-containing protein n=1 Tax=Parapedobacter pyrenivorans TaxID=1305674 RepID=A0A917MAV6_9SPHI|nr:serine hydrolase domain-containing protein [Parapedobacter pyrenivorans]GGG90091.1 hypothetical protein GCM10007415_25600 [Parapedobacter pyrenivorans]
MLEYRLNHANKTLMALAFMLLSTTIALGQVSNYYDQPISIPKLEQTIRQAMDSLDVPGMSVAILNEGKVVYCKGFGFADIAKKKKVTATTFFEAASMSKPVFSYYVLTLAKEGKIDLTRPLYKYLPEPDIVDERYKEITAQMVLSHTTGLPNWRESPTMELAFNPGQEFAYSGEAYMYLAKVVANLNNITLWQLDENFQHEIARPLKLKDFHFVLTAKVASKLATAYQDGKPVEDERDRSMFDPAGGLYANAANFSKFLIALMNQRESYSDMFKPVIELSADNPLRSIFGINAWTLGLAEIKIGESTNFWHGGNNLGYTSSFMIDPKKQFGYVFFTNADQCNGMKMVFENILWN